MLQKAGVNFVTCDGGGYRPLDMEQCPDGSFRIEPAKDGENFFPASHACEPVMDESHGWLCSGGAL
jgi:hypothetical protein